MNEEGKEIGDGAPGAEGFAPPHPDVERQPETRKGAADGGGGGEGREGPASASAEEDVRKEREGKGKEKGVPRPGSEREEATKK